MVEASAPGKLVASGEYAAPALVSAVDRRVSCTLDLCREGARRFDAWMQSTCADFDAACRAVRGRDLAALTEIADYSCLKLHALMFSTRPGLLYWNAATTTAIQPVGGLRRAGTPVFFTVDTKAQMKAVCTPEAASAVTAWFRRLPGVKRVLLGGGARVVAG